MFVNLEVLIKIFLEYQVIIEIVSVTLGLAVGSLVNINITGIWKLLFLRHCTFSVVKLVFCFLTSQKFRLLYVVQIAAFIRLDGLPNIRAFELKSLAGLCF